MQYRLIALDLDGTLLGSEGVISAENIRAIGDARAAGAIVVPCTGRAWHESRHLFQDVPGLELGVFVGGAVVSEMDTGRSLDFAVMEAHLVAQLIDLLRDEPEAILLFREPERVGHHFFITGHGQVTANTRLWFEMTGAKLAEKRDPDPEDLHHVLRVGMVAEGGRLPELAREIDGRFGDRVLVHHFAGLQQRDVDPVHILEVFASGVDKWRGLSWIARQHGIAPEQVAAIGDEVNDLAMIRHAGCGVAMGNAVPEIRDIARRQTRPHHEDGVAHAIDQMLAGAW
jgi:hypothetical protein